MNQVFRFSQGLTDGDASMRDILGGKGAGLAEMCRLGVPVPPGFTISTAACIQYLQQGGNLSEDLRHQVLNKLGWLEKELGKTLAGDGPPLLLSVRSGARVSMPGMMDTILNLGLNDQAAESLATVSGDQRFAYDSYRRFIQMYSNVVLGLEHHHFEIMLERKREQEGVQVDSKISAQGMVDLVGEYKNIVFEETNTDFPTDPLEQLWGAIRAVFDSWNNSRARYYRKIHEIPDDWGTAVTVQSMVFGNLGDQSGTGVCFSRNPATGEPGPYGEYLKNAQGEDVVAGIRTPGKINDPDDPASMQAAKPELYVQLSETLALLENHYGDMQDTEFTFENGRLYLLQTRSGKRTSKAGLRIAIDMCEEGLINERQAVLKVDPASMAHLLSSEFDQKSKKKILEEGRLLATGLNAGPGAATGKMALSPEMVAEMQERGEPAILVRVETSPEDIEGMHAAQGILTQRGGLTSHAAVVARGMGKPCVVGCDAMIVSLAERCIRFGKRILKEGDYLSIDGSTGEVILGEISTEDAPLIRQLKEDDYSPGSQGEQFRKLMSWVKEHTSIGVRANADTPTDARLARLLGAQGIGLCRTEHMFFGDDRILQVRKMILSESAEGRQEALAALQPFQEEDFYGLFVAMDGLPVTIRLLDPPLHEFLPRTAVLIEGLATAMEIAPDQVRDAMAALHEANPMLGHRGCRLGISHPEIYRMQVAAIVGAVLRARKQGIQVRPEIMVPLVTSRRELDEVANSVRPLITEAGLDIPIGTMIEIPRAALCAGEIAESAAFFSFGTNDLTQCGLGLSRDDSAGFLPLYLERGIFERDPFKSLDQEGIGQLVAWAVRAGRERKPDLKLGVCGEHGGDPRSITFFHSVGLDYVSCSPFRVPVALLAGARASIEAQKLT